MKNLARLLAPLALASSLTADVFVVDDDGGPGVDFTAIQPAIDQASHGDVIAVAPGTYDAFTLGLGLSVIGLDATPNTTRVDGLTRIVGVPAGRTAQVSGLRLRQTKVGNCNGVVLLDNLELRSFASDPPADALFNVTNCWDVRLLSSDVLAGSFEPGGLIRDSRVEIVDSYLRGSAGFDVGCSGFAGDGGDGLRIEGSSEVVAYQSNIEGGAGGNTPEFCEWSDPWAGDGGQGVYVGDGSELVLAGDDQHYVRAGQGGYGDGFPCCTDGWPGRDLELLGTSFTRYSGIQVNSIEQGPDAGRFVPGTPDPYLQVFGTQQAGRRLNFRVFGTPGATAFLYLGRDAILLPAPGPVDQRTSRQRTFLLGPLDGSGEGSFSLNVPVWAPLGFSFHAQAEVRLGGGDDRLTNAVPIVIRYHP